METHLAWLIITTNLFDVGDFHFPVYASGEFRVKIKFDYIIISPGINIQKSNFKSLLLRNKKKIITDLDLFYLKNNVKKSIVITGTNGKSTTCSLVHHILKKNKIKNKLAGNIGKPILKTKFFNNDIYVIEASSFQLEYLNKHFCCQWMHVLPEEQWPRCTDMVFWLSSLPWATKSPAGISLW